MSLRHAGKVLMRAAQAVRVTSRKPAPTRAMPSGDALTFFPPSRKFDSHLLSILVAALELFASYGRRLNKTLSSRNCFYFYLLSFYHYIMIIL